jgi:hypothetical protein
MERVCDQAWPFSTNLATGVRPSRRRRASADGFPLAIAGAMTHNGGGSAKRSAARFPPPRVPLMLRTATVLALALFAATAAADTQAPRISLFNGRDLTGWHQHKCEAAVENGLLVIKGGEGLLWHDFRLRKFVLELEWRPRKTEKYDSGIYFRCELPPEGKPFPSRYQVNLKQGDEANLIGFPQGKCQGIVKPGEWNKLKLRVDGEAAEMVINDQPAWQVNGITAADGQLGIQVEVPLGGEYEFRNLFVTELQYRSLFNGQDLTGWEGAGQPADACWGVEEGLLVCNGKRGPWLRSAEEHGDFNLRLEYRLKAGGNSGVYIRTPMNGNHHGDDAGIEVQILDDAAPRYKDLKEYQYTGSLYAIVPAEPRVAKEAGEWNSLEINCLGTRYHVIHNGVVIISADEATAAELGKRRTKGYLGLQNHSEHVWFRNVRIGPPVETVAVKAEPK